MSRMHPVRISDMSCTCFGRILCLEKRAWQLHKGHSESNQQGILGHLSDFDEIWCVCSTYGAHHPY